MKQMMKEDIERLEKNARYLGPCNVFTYSGNYYSGDVIVTSNNYIIHNIAKGAMTILNKNSVSIVELSQTEDQFS